MIFPIILGLVLAAIVGIGEPSFQDGLDAMSTPYPSLNTTDADTWCIVGLAWCFSTVIDWFSLVPSYVEVTATRVEGFTNSTDVVLNPANLTVVGQQGAFQDVAYVWLAVIFMFSIGVVITLAQLLRGNS